MLIIDAVFSYVHILRKTRQSLILTKTKTHGKEKQME
jgi:hypothetical protein